MRHYADRNGLKPSFTCYKQWGRKNKPTIKLRFSRTGNEYMEKLYATHYVRNASADENTDKMRRLRHDI